MHLVNAIRCFDPLEPWQSPNDRPDDYWTAYASRLVAAPNCGRMEIGEDVLDAAHSVLQSRPSTILGAINLARPPFPVTWLEWRLPPNDESLRHGWLLVQDEPGLYRAILFGIDRDDHLLQINIGFLIETNHSNGRASPMSDDEIEAAKNIYKNVSASENLSGAMHSSSCADGRKSGNIFNSDNSNQKSWSIFSESEFTAIYGLSQRVRPYWVADGEFNTPIQGNESAFQGALFLGRELLAVLLLLKSRNAIAVGNEQDLTAINKKRLRKRGAQPLLPLRPVILDLTRRLRASRRSGNHVPISEVRAALVKGHFKVRKSGVFWWSPHVRGEAEKISGRDYLVRTLH